MIKERGNWGSRKPYSPTKSLVPPTKMVSVRVRSRVRIRGSGLGLGLGLGFRFGNLVGGTRYLVGE